MTATATSDEVEGNMISMALKQDKTRRNRIKNKKTRQRKQNKEDKTIISKKGTNKTISSSQTKKRGGKQR